MAFTPRLVLAWIILCASLLPAAAVPTTWTESGNLNVGRQYLTATLLNSGMVLVAGGVNFGDPLSSAELYDPATGIWALTGSMTDGREFHTATLLPNGMVLIAGGIDSTNWVASTELYDPATGQWTATGSMQNVRTYHTATLLNTGKVLVTGGENANGDLTSCELYDPATGQWSVTGSMVTARKFHTATLLNNGKVLVAGGTEAVTTLINTAELYDPTTGQWTQTGTMSYARSSHSATLLPSGQVLVAGGGSATSGSGFPELYTVATGVWTKTGQMVTPRTYHTATLLGSGEVLVAGGEDYTNTTLASSELFNPATSTWSATVNLNVEHYDHTSTLLNNGLVLVAGGGFNNSGFPVTTELYNSGETPQTINFPAIADQVFGDAPFALQATASSGLAVTFSVFSGPASLSGKNLTVLGPGTVIVTASQSGNATYLPITNVQQSFNVTSPSSMSYAQWQAMYSTGGPATVTENGNVPNLLKYLYDINPTKAMGGTDFVAMPCATVDTTSTPGTTYNVLKYRQYISETGITISLQESSDMQTWTTVSAAISQPVADDSVTGDPIWETGVVASASSKFLRLNVSIP